MRDIQTLRELIFGLAIMTPLGCQSPPAVTDTDSSETVEKTAEDPEVVANPVHPVPPEPPEVCKTLDEVHGIQTGLYEQEFARWERAQGQGQPLEPSDARFSAPRSKPERPEPPTACPEFLTTHISYSRCSVSTTTLTLQGSRSEGDVTSCCYIDLSFGRPRRPCGRLYYVEEQATRAQTETNRNWMGADVERPPGVPEELAMEAAEAWLEDALEEHASIGAFSRATLELMALGAPAELLAGYQRASLEEIEHARLCFSLVGALLGREVSAGAISVEGPRDDLDAIIADVFWGGCVGESVAALCAKRALTGCAWGPARRALEVISEDEASHAALAWSTLSFFGQVHPERVRRVLGGVQAPELEVESGGGGQPGWVALGRLTHAQEAQAESDAWDHLISPMLSELLAA